MKGYLKIKLDDGTWVYKPNVLYKYEAERAFRSLVAGTALSTVAIDGDLLFKGDHILNEASGTSPLELSYYNVRLNNSMPALSSIGQYMRLRRFITTTNLAPAQPSQIAYAQGRISARATTTTPDAAVSSTDINFKQIGSVFGHPSGREAFFNETAVTPLGVGSVFSSGCLDFATGSNGSPAISGSNTGEEGHYIYSIFATKTGDLNGAGDDAEYYFIRQPYYVGAFAPGAAEADGYTSAETLSDRYNASSTSRGFVNIQTLFCDTDTPAPTQVPYVIDYPTQASNASSVSSIISGMCFDGLAAGSGSSPRKSGKIWWTVTDRATNDHANATTSRSLWAWKRFTGETPSRKDASDSISTEALSAFPTLPTNVQFRDLKPGRNGYLYLACDSDGDTNDTGTDVGALIMIDAAGDAVLNVIGTTASGIYDVAGLQSNNTLGIAIDKSGLHTNAAELDRVWALHRDGLSYIDVFTSTGIISGSVVTVSDAGSDFNTIDSDSVRGLAGFVPRGSSAVRNNHGTLIDVDSSGNVYWVSTQTAGNNTTGIQRLNSIQGSDFSHAYYSMHTTAEVNAAGFIHLGLNAGVAGQSGSINTLIINRKDTGDPESDDIWLATQNGDNQFISKNITRIPIDSWLSGSNNIGVGFYGDTLDDGLTDVSYHVSVAPGGAAWFSADTASTIGLLEPNGKVVSGSGTGTSMSSPTIIGGKFVQEVVIPADDFTEHHVGKRIVLSTTSNSINSGSFVVTGVLDNNTIQIVNSGTSEVSSFNWTCIGEEFDATGTIGGSPGSWQAAEATECHGYNWFTDDSGVAYIFRPRNGAAIGRHDLVFSTPTSWQWSTGSSTWYRSRVHHRAAASTKLVHSSSEKLANGVEVAFSGSGTGGSEFVQDEYYTFPVSIGLVKDSTQEITWGYDIFAQKTELIESPLAEALSVKTAESHSCVGGFLDVASLASVTSDDIFVLAASSSAMLAAYQRRLLLDGTNNTQTIGGSGGTLTTTAGFQTGIDLQADIITSKLGFAWEAMPAATYADVKMDLYSATDAAGSGSWTLRSSYQSNEDHPAWNLRTDAFHDDSAANDSFATSPNEVVIDLELLGGSGSFGTNSARRYWKLAFYQWQGTAAVTPNMAGNFALNAAGDNIGYSDNQRLLTANDTNYMANHIVRAVFIQDSGTSFSTGPAVNQVTATGGNTFATGSFAVNDLFRVVESSIITDEHVIASVDSSTQLTLATAVKLGKTNEAWEIVRNADVRPRDDEGGSEDQAEFPPSGGAGVGQVYICPITGHIFYNDTDITNNRLFRTERYIKVKREI